MLTTFAALISGAAFLVAPPAVAEWPMFGANLQNTASANSTGVTQGNVAKLDLKWKFQTGGDVSARAAVVGGVVYFPDWGGNLWAVDAKTGAAIWGKQLKSYISPTSPQVNSRTSPAVSDGVVYIGTQEGAYLLAIRASDGQLLWKTQLETPLNDFAAIVTTSPVVYNGVVYSGVASSQENVAAFPYLAPGFVCCTARGSVVAVNAGTGAIQWRTYMVPLGYSGGGVWGSNLVVDPSRGSLFASTGNNYSHPTDPAYLSCISGGGTPATCASPQNHVDSIVSLDLATGAVKWSTKLVTWNQFGVTDGSDDWNVACLLGLPPTFAPPGPFCPSNPGPDYDFASAPNLITYNSVGGGQKTILGAGQKSGIYYALNPDNGAVQWQTQVGPGSSLGGMEWGSASDGKRIYVSIANLYGIPSAGGNAGSWAALDPATGTVLWRTPDPNGSIALGPLTVAKDVVYVSSMSGAVADQTMLALDAATGVKLWGYAPGVSVNAGPSLDDSTVYWGSGYAHLGIPGYTGGGPQYFYAFTHKGK